VLCVVCCVVVISNWRWYRNTRIYMYYIANVRCERMRWSRSDPLESQAEESYIVLQYTSPEVRMASKRSYVRRGSDRIDSYL